MKNKLCKLISVIMVTLITVLMLLVVGERVERKESDIKNKAFFEEKNNYDILFLGTSHMINGVYPMELWDDYGYTSYNLANHSTPLATSYWVLMNALDYTQPKLVVLDCFGWQAEGKLSSETAYTHKALDCFPMTLTKYRAIKDLTTDSDELGAMELMWDFSIYHNRWNQLEYKDFEIDYNNQRGAERRIDVATPVEYTLIDPDVTLDVDSVGKAYVQKIIDECNKRDIEVLLTWLPYPPFREEAQAVAHSITSFAEENNVNYINFLDMDVVRFDTDLYDEDSHLNPSGAMKVTSYLGDFIRENYELEDHRDQAGYESWEEDMTAYALHKKEGLIYETDPVIYLMLLNDSDFDIRLDWNGYECLEDEIYSSLISNLGIDMSKVHSYTSNIISGRYKDRNVSYADSELVFDEAYNVSITVFDASSGEQFDNIWLYYAPGEETTITHIYY